MIIGMLVGAGIAIVSGLIGAAIALAGIQSKDDEDTISFP